MKQTFPNKTNQTMDCKMFDTNKGKTVKSVWRHYLNELKFTVSCHKCLCMLKAQKGKGSFSGLYQTIKLMEQKL